MPITVAFEDAQGPQENRNEGGLSRITPFIGASPLTPGSAIQGERDSPQAYLVQYSPSRWTRTHYHEVDQFQIVIAGKGRIGRHELGAYSIHFARAYTPYGPLVAADEGMTFLTLRRHRDPAGARKLPESKALLEQVPQRRPWQATEVIDPHRFATAHRCDVLVEPMSALKDDRGLAGCIVQMQSNTCASAPDPSHGAGQYVIVLEGSLLHGGKEHRALTVVYVESGEGSFHIQAGAHGLKGLVLTFPRSNLNRASAANPSSGRGLKTWQCLLCSFVYREEEGLPHEGIAPGTRWADVPESWSCPDCGATKSDFHMMEI